MCHLNSGISILQRLLGMNCREICSIKHNVLFIAFQRLLYCLYSISKGTGGVTFFAQNQDVFN